MPEKNIPIYSLHNFSSTGTPSQQFQVEIFDANRHFAVEYPHRHDFFEILYLSKGTGDYIVDGNKYDIKPPCIFFMSPGQVHSIDLSRDIEGYIFLFASDFYQIKQRNPNRLVEFPFFFSIKQDNPPLIFKKQKDIKFIESLFLKAIDETDNSENVSLELLRSILDLILTFCAALYPYEQNRLQGKGHIVVKRFFQLLEENYSKNLSVAEYANIMALTPNHLTQVINQLTGKTSSQLIKTKQTLEIKRLLAYTNLSVTEIATKMSFPDQSYFAKFFKRETGLSPLQYRKESFKH